VQKIFAQHWNCVGRSSAVSNSGDYIVREVAGESLVIVRDRSGALRAFFNVCRHRGTQLCSADSGHFAGNIQCPYHAWSYSTDGRLVGAPHMQDVPDFDKADHSLREAALAEWEGFIFANVARDPEPFAEWFAPMLGRLDRFGLAHLDIGHSQRYYVHANWKLVFENYSECQHCPMIHPELTTVLPYNSGANDLVEGPFLGGYMEIAPPHASATISGRACGRRVSDALEGDDLRRAYYYALMPNMLLSVHPDYVNYYMIAPVSVDRTIVDSQWLFAPQNKGEPGFNPGDAIEFWDVTNRQDWEIVAANQRGISSSRYTPGPYSPRESIPAAWDREYLRMMGSA
jgi:Rieske 2Fe-2S family protein